jgi:hypothetical protein
MNPATPHFSARRERFVPCTPRPGVVKPLLAQAQRAMSGLTVLISPAVFKPEKPQAGLHYVQVAPGPLNQINLNNLKRGEIYRGKISRQKIKPTSKKGRLTASYTNE